MSLFSFFRKNKQGSAKTTDDSAFYSRAEPEPTKPRTRRRKSGEGDAAMDPMLPEKKRARRRLIGAVALVLAAVIGLPMILDSEPKPLADDIAIQIPSKDKPSSLRSPASSAVPAARSLDAAEEVIDPPSEPAARSSATVAPEPTKQQERKAEPEAAKTATVEQPAAAEAKPDAKLDKPAKVTEKANNGTDDSARALALLEGKTDPKPAAAKADGKFVIQVAALASKDKVNELQTRLKNAGIKSYTQKVATDSGDRIRIRVGPFASKEEAERMRAKIVKLGLNGTLVPA